MLYCKLDSFLLKAMKKKNGIVKSIYEQELTKNGKVDKNDKLSIVFFFSISLKVSLFNPLVPGVSYMLHFAFLVP